MADSVSPDVGQHIDADGNVTYDFQGHVFAEGLDLPAYATLDTRAQIRWISQTNGALVAQVNVSEAPIGGGAVMFIGGQRTNLTFDDRETAFATPVVGAGASHSDGSGTGVIVIDADGNSDFARTWSTGLLRIDSLYSVDSGSLSPGDTSVATVFHNLGHEAFPFASPSDAGFGYDVEWTWNTVDVNSTRFAFRARPDGNDPARVILAVLLLTFD